MSGSPSPFNPKSTRLSFLHEWYNSHHISSRNKPEVAFERPFKTSNGPLIEPDYMHVTPKVGDLDVFI